MLARSASLLFALLSIAPPALPQRELRAAAAPAPAALAALEERVDALRRERGIPGIGCALRAPDGSVIAFGCGIADLENDVPVRAETVFRLASISKPLTAVTALRLAERGELDLDRPVGELVPRWRDKRWPVSARQLLGHLGGVRHYRPGELLSNRRYASVTESIAIFADDPLLHEPGSAFHYTTYGYNLLGAAIEAAAGEPFADVLRREVLEPAGCATLVVDDSAAIVRHRARGYRRNDDGLANSHPVDTSNKIPGGGLCGTPSDLVRFAGALLDGRLLREDTLDAMWSSMTTADGTATGYGMGWSVRSDGGRRVVSHTGGQPRVSTLLWIDLEARTAVALMANLEGESRALRRLAPLLQP